MIERRIRICLLTGATAGVVLIALGIGDAGSAARGWLGGFVFISMFPIGALALLLVHGLTGGRWGNDLASVLVPLACTLPLLLIAAIPIIALRPLIYDWPQHGIAPDVARLYMNPAFFDLRMIAALSIWSLLAWMRAWQTKLFAALGLCAHAVCMIFIPTDWILSVEPGSTSAGFGFGFTIEQIFAALALCAALAPQGPEPRANRDLAGMLIAALLGTVYFIYVQFVITWYGNIPEHVKWYATRAVGTWPAVAFAAFAIGAAIPFLMFLNAWVRQNSQALRIAGVLILCGIALHIGWLIVPSVGAAAIPAALLSAAIIACAIMMTALRSGQAVEARHVRA